MRSFRVRKFSERSCQRGGSASYSACLMSLALLIRRDLASVMKYRLWAYWHWLRAGEVGAPPPQVQSYKRKRKSWDANGDEIAQAPCKIFTRPSRCASDSKAFLFQLVTELFNSQAGVSMKAATPVYGFKPMPLDQVLQTCVDFFERGCVDYPEEAKKAAMKLPSEPAATALKVLERSCG
ncbi:unnamed protein product [Symbiodinium pilosum]|uniref:Uncharacterized protein n=1 Tax=Symbiodinium pilosum TaxID=2952 RepID=A0A812YEV6_SYMPI|nr:unnamed protein product [Symbiodinium pilosum]